ncbi:MAG: hypothetical protein R3321_01320 [Nitrososphaeraceae archaeon]|nr:hypothetical protein [Nitrososphaeraceae archaeon]
MNKKIVKLQNIGKLTKYNEQKELIYKARLETIKEVIEDLNKVRFEIETSKKLLDFDYEEIKVIDDKDLDVELIHDSDLELRIKVGENVKRYTLPREINEVSFIRLADLIETHPLALKFFLKQLFNGELLKKVLKSRVDYIDLIVTDKDQWEERQFQLEDLSKEKDKVNEFIRNV